MKGAFPKGSLKSSYANKNPPTIQLLTHRTRPKNFLVDNVLVDRLDSTKSSASNANGFVKSGLSGGPMADEIGNANVLRNTIEFVASYSVWAKIGIVSSIVLFLVSLIFGRTASSTESDGSSDWKTVDWLPRPAEEKMVEELNSNYRIHREMYAGVGKSELTGLRLGIVFMGISKRAKKDLGEIRVRVQSKAMGNKTPELMVFIFRDRDGYQKLEDINPNNGLPKKSKKSDDWNFGLSDYKNGDRVKILVYVVPSAENNAEISALGADQLFSWNLETEQPQK
jgi:hypothetical protein